MLKSVPGDFEELYYTEIFTIGRFTIERVDCIESAQYSVKSEPGDFEQLYYMEIFTIGRFTIERDNCIRFGGVR